MQETLGNDANDIVEALRRAHRDAVIFKVFPQRSKKHGIGLPILESPGASQQFIRDGVDYFVRSRPADALFLDARSLILENTNALNAIKLRGCIRKESVEARDTFFSQFAHDEIGKSATLESKNPASAGMAPPSATTDPLVTLALAS